MEFRSLGATGLKVSVLSFGTMSFAGNDRQSVVGTTDVAEARRLVDRCLDAEVNLFDTADVPRMLAVAPNGDLFVSEFKAGKVLVMPDRDGDGVADESRVFAPTGTSTSYTLL